jgi:hypothetical protein
MFRRIAAGALVCGLAALAGACSKTTPTTPSGNSTTETFTGTLTPNSANTHVFVAAAAGNITATLTSVGPDATQTIGFSMGTYSALTNVCTIVLSSDAAPQGFQLQGQAATQGSYCMRIFDNGSVAAMQSAGSISSSNPFTYTITVSHP